MLSLSPSLPLSLLCYISITYQYPTALKCAHLYSHLLLLAVGRENSAVVLRRERLLIADVDVALSLDSVFQKIHSHSHTHIHTVRQTRAHTYILSGNAHTRTHTRTHTHSHQTFTLSRTPHTHIIPRNAHIIHIPTPTHNIPSTHTHTHTHTHISAVPNHAKVPLSFVTITSPTPPTPPHPVPVRSTDKPGAAAQARAGGAPAARGGPQAQCRRGPPPGRRPLPRRPQAAGALSQPHPSFTLAVALLPRHSTQASPPSAAAGQADVWRQRFDSEEDTEVSRRCTRALRRHTHHELSPHLSLPQLGTRVSLLAAFFDGKREDDGARLVRLRDGHVCNTCPLSFSHTTPSCSPPPHPPLPLPTTASSPRTRSAPRLPQSSGRLWTT